MVVEESNIKVLPKVNFTLEAAKKDIKQKIVSFKEPVYQLNLIPQIMGGEISRKANVQALENFKEEKKKSE